MRDDKKGRRLGLQGYRARDVYEAAEHIQKNRSLSCPTEKPIEEDRRGVTDMVLKAQQGTSLEPRPEE